MFSSVVYKSPCKSERVRVQAPNVRRDLRGKILEPRGFERLQRYAAQRQRQQLIDKKQIEKKKPKNFLKDTGEAG